MKTRGGLFIAVVGAVLALSLGLWPTAGGAAGSTASDTTVADNASGLVTGGTLIFTVTVTGSAGTPTGDVGWVVTDPNSQPVNCTTSTTTLDGNGQATCSITDALAGTYSATVSYLGDTTYDTSSGADLAATVPTANSATGVVDSASGISTGGSFTFTATVTGPGVTPTGGISWTVTDPNSQSVTCTTSTTTLDGGGQATCSIDNALAGTYSATANYLGDTNYTSSSGSDPGADVAAANSATGVVDSASGVSTGGSFTLTATVTGPGVTPTGGISWTVTDPHSQPVNCTTSTTTLNSGGHATCSIDNALAGTYTATANYLGDSNYDASSGSDPGATVGKAGSSTVVNADTTGIATGGTLTFTASVTGPGVTPTGGISWTVTDPNSQPMNCTTSTITLDGAGQATCSVTNVVAGTYSATAHYLGDTNYTSSSGSDPSAFVGEAGSSTVVIDNATGISTGGTLTFTATVTGPGALPTGGITWVVTNPNSAPVNCTISNTTLDSGGQATCSITNALAGMYSATANYLGDSNYSSSSGHDTTASIDRPSIASVPSAATYGGNFVASVTSRSDGTPTVVSGTTGVCSVSSGLTVSFVGVGTCTLTPHTGATSDYTASAGAPESFAVGLATPITPLVTDIPSGATEFGSFVASVFTNGDGTTSVASISTAVCTVGNDAHTVTFVGFGVCTLTATVAQGVHFFGATGNTQSFPVGPATRGYWLVGSDGGIFSFGAASFFGSMGSTPLQRPVVGITPSASRTGYWLVASDGGIFSFGTSAYYGSIPAVGLHPAGSGAPNSLNAPIVGMVPSVSGHGYFMVASDGGVFAFGDAHFAGSCPGLGGCAGKAVAVMPDSTGNGYWLVTTTGNVYAFGDATFYGAPAPSTAQVVDAVATQDWRGYWLLYNNGVVASFGDATTMGAPLGYVNAFNPATSIFPTADGRGYWIASGRGDVFAYGDAPYLGSEAASGLNGEIIAAFGF